LIAIGLVIAAGALALVAVCWRTRTALGGLLGAISVALVGLAIASGSAHPLGRYALLGAGAALVIGAALFGIGHAVQRLLDSEPSEQDLH
jgi:hypothetical protein